MNAGAAQVDGQALIRRIVKEQIDVHPIVDYGWPDSVELAVIDAVLSIRARYGTFSTGVLGRVRRYRDEAGSLGADDLRVLAARDRAQLINWFGQQKSAGRLKADLILEVAGRLVDAGVVHAIDVDPKNEGQRKAWVGTRGLGWVTWEYCTMLVGKPGVKADTMITQFVAQSLAGERVDPERAHAAIHAAASQLKVNPRDLDQTLWRVQSGRPPRRLSNPED